MSNDEIPEESRIHFLNGSLSSSFNGSSNIYSGLHVGEDEIRKKLEWYFKTPFEKYKDRGRKPFKFVLQIIKIILVTVQATLFAVDQFSIVSFNNDNLETFRNIFVFEYDGFPEKSLYTAEDAYMHMFFTWNQYYNFDDIMMGSYNMAMNNDTQQPILLCLYWNTRLREVLKQNEIPTLVYFPVIDDSNITDGACKELKPPDSFSNETDFEDFIKENSLPMNIGSIYSMTLSFPLHINSSVVHRMNSPDCYDFFVELVFDNRDLDGTMTVALTSSVDFRNCRIGSYGIRIRESGILKSSQTIFDFVIIIICTISLCLCIRSFKQHFQLCKATSAYFKEFRHEEFTLSDKMNFLSFWLVLILISDVCSITGSGVKIAVDWLEYPELYTICSLLFGLAALSSWIGILRYLGYIQGWNTLLITLKTAFPAIIRFICCVSFIYIGFTICGWIVLGPYHEKFSDLSTASECLFSLINGDDMYNTFFMVEDANQLIFYFSRFYLYIFISLFIFVVLSLFIGIVADTYERIKDNKTVKTRVELFAEGNEYHVPIQSRESRCNKCKCVTNKNDLQPSLVESA